MCLLFCSPRSKLEGSRKYITCICKLSLLQHFFFTSCSVWINLHLKNRLLCPCLLKRFLTQCLNFLIVTWQCLGIFSWGWIKGVYFRFNYLFPMILHGNKWIFNNLILHYLIIITCVSCENICTISLPKCINIAPLSTCLICVTLAVSHGHSVTDYTG